MVKRALEALKDVKTIAFLAVGMGHHKYPPEIAAELMIGAIFDFFRDTPNCQIETITIHVYKRWTAMYTVNYLFTCLFSFVNYFIIAQCHLSLFIYLLK